EKRSGADGERKELARLHKAVRPDDTVVVTRLDRLARSTRDLLNTHTVSPRLVLASSRCARLRLTPRPHRAGWWSRSYRRSVNSSASSSCRAPAKAANVPAGTAFASVASPN